MALKMANKNERQDPVAIGNYPARVVQVIDMGLQNQRPYLGVEKPPANMLRITYELVDEFCLDANGVEDETKPRWISEEFPMFPPFAERAKCNKRYSAIDPDLLHDHNWAELAGSACTVTIVHGKGKGKNEGVVYDNVGNITPYVVNRRNPELPDLVNPVKLLDLDEPDVKVFKALPEWIQKRITGNLEFRGSKLEIALGNAALPEEPDRNIPEAPVADAPVVEAFIDEEEEW